MNHTPLPWHWKYSAYRGGYVVLAVVSSGHKEICTTGWAPKNSKLLEEAKANARLITSAPVMYNALAVIAKTPHIRAYLETHDPKALQQVDEALKETDSPSE